MESSRTVDGNIRVYSRFRPLNPREISECAKPVHRKLSRTSVLIRTQKEREELNFTFDGVFDVDSTQQDIYETAGRPVITSLFDGFNGTIFAYGQTASGKTYTMQGPSTNDSAEKRGVIPRAVDQIFVTIEQSPCNVNFTIKVSVVEIYLQKVRDLLEPSNHNLKIRSQPKRGTFIQGVTEEYVASREELIGFYTEAVQNRATLSTRQNDRSSRSHFVMTITVSQEDTQELTVRQGKLFLVDLAGSEKTSRSGVEGISLQEANKINSSLTSLGKVIKALSDSRQQHVPYRQSKLTRILQESLGGNSKTTLIVTCSPFSGNLNETLSTMRFGVSTRKIRNRPTVNRQLSLSEMQVLLDKTRNESLEKSRKIAMLQNFIRNEMGQVPEMGLQASTCCSCYVGRGSSSPEFADVQCQSPTKSEAYDGMSDRDSYTRFGESETEGYLTARSEDVSFLQSQYQTCSNTNPVRQADQPQTEQPIRRSKLLTLQISCSNIDEPTEVDDDDFNKPLTERTPRWVGMEHPQQNQATERMQSCYNDSIMPVVNTFYDRQPQRKNDCQWFRSGANSLQTSFCAGQEQQPLEFNLAMVENPEGLESMPTSRPGYNPNQRDKDSPATPNSLRNNTITEESLDESGLRETWMTWQQRSELFRKRVTAKEQQSRKLAQNFEALRQQRQHLRERFKKIAGAGGNTPRGCS